jgi:hypothetical protein
MTGSSGIGSERSKPKCLGRDLSRSSLLISAASDAAIVTAKQLRAVGTRLFLFQQGRRSERAFKVLAEATGGAYFQFNPHIERVAERLPGMLEAVTHFVIGGMAALEARDNESAVSLLGQMNAAGQIAQGTRQMDEA